MKRIKYKTTDMFGDYPEGAVIRAYRLTDGKDGENVLVYHPADRHGCGSIDVCRLDKHSGCYVTVDQNAYVNLGYRSDTPLVRLLDGFIKRATSRTARRTR